MPHDRLKLLDVGRAALGRSVDDDADVGFPRSGAVGPTDDSEDACAHFPRKLDRTNQVHRDVVRAAPSSNGEHQDRVPG